MEANEIMVNEEVIENTAEEIVKASSGKVLMVAGGIGLAVLAGVVAYKYVAKPAIARFKAKDDWSDVIDAEATEIVEDENVEPKEDSEAEE